MPIDEFAVLAVTTTARAAIDPSFLQSLIDYRASVAGIVTDEKRGSYDYYRSDGDSNFANRLSFVALVDWAYSGLQGRSSIGWKVLEDSFERLLPRFLVAEKKTKNYGIGDFIAWQTGQFPIGYGAYLNYSLAMEGYATFGPFGLIAYPFVFMLPLLWILTRISSFRSATAASLFLFCSYQHIFVESTSEVITAELARGLPVYFTLLLGIQLFTTRPRTSNASTE